MKILGMVLLTMWVVLAGTGAFASSQGVEILNPQASRSKRVTIAMETVGDEFDVQMKLVSMIENQLIEEGYHIVPEAEDADLVIMPTIGKMKSKHPDEQSFAAPKNQTNRNKPLTKNSKTSQPPSNHANEPSCRVGLLLSAYQSKDWLNMANSGKTPLPVWRIYDSLILPESAHGSECEALVEKCLLKLKHPPFEK